MLRPVALTFRLEQLILAPKLLEPGTDGVAFHPDPNAVFLESAEIGENPTELPTDRLELTLGDSPCGLAGLRIGMSVFELPVKLVQEIGVNTPQVRLSLRLHHAWDQELFFAIGAPDISTCISGPYPQGGRTARTNHRHTINLGTDRVHHQDGGRGFVVTRGRRKIRREGLELVIAVLAADVAAAPGILDPQADLAVGTARDKLRRRLVHGFSSPQQASRGS